jgi:quinol monooxygenase YgiN
MSHVLIIHEVADYPAWKRVFDAAADIRKEAGERSYQVLKYQSDPNKIVHFSVWTSHADARAFFESPKLVQIRQDAVVKSPDFIAPTSSPRSTAHPKPRPRFLPLEI